MYSTTATKYDVFLSFRGLDTRRTFISFLYKELVVRRKIRTFKDDEELESGQRISTDLNRAIEDSKIAVIVISVKYAESPWCLKELVKIMDFEKNGKITTEKKKNKIKKITVMPIFYGVNTGDVRWQINDVAKQFKKHEDREDPEEVLSWRRALTELADLSGYCSWEWDDDAELVDQIADQITKKLIDATSSKPKHLVENGKHMREIERLLDLNPNEKLRIVGIWARGCKSRRALATNAYYNFNPRFDRHCFLGDVEKISPGRYSVFIHEGFLTERENSSNPKVLLVANNVNDLKQFDALADEFNRFGPGSVVIIATEDKRLFNAFSINYVYEQEDLRFQEVSAPIRSIPFKKSVISMDSNSPNNVCCLQEKEEVDSFELFLLGSTWF